MISQLIERGVLALKAAVTRVFVSLRISPNLLTVTSLVPTAFATYYLAHGRFTVAGLWIIAAGFFDVIDGAVARALGRMTPFGAVLDSVTDRASDAFIYVGAALYFYRIGEPGYGLLTMVALTGALMVSYTRARAENTVLDCQVGFAERGERMVLMLLALFLHKLGAAMWMLAALAWLTTIQRLLHTHRALAAGQQRAPAEPA
ncbi:MAG TPA: CDP-alcohol phosphatidyltransferase family protein [Acidobacteriota bacterium]